MCIAILCLNVEQKQLNFVNNHCMYSYRKDIATIEQLKENNSKNYYNNRLAIAIAVT